MEELNLEEELQDIEAFEAALASGDYRVEEDDGEY